MGLFSPKQPRRDSAVHGVNKITPEVAEAILRGCRHHGPRINRMLADYRARQPRAQAERQSRRNELFDRLSD